MERELWSERSQVALHQQHYSLCIHFHEDFIYDFFFVSSISFYGSFHFSNNKSGKFMTDWNLSSSNCVRVLISNYSYGEVSRVANLKICCKNVKITILHVFFLSLTRKRTTAYIGFEFFRTFSMIFYFSFEFRINSII